MRVETFLFHLKAIFGLLVIGKIEVKLEISKKSALFRGKIGKFDAANQTPQGSRARIITNDTNDTRENFSETTKLQSQSM